MLQSTSKYQHRVLSETLRLSHSVSARGLVLLSVQYSLATCISYASRCRVLVSFAWAPWVCTSHEAHCTSTTKTKWNILLYVSYLCYCIVAQVPYLVRLLTPQQYNSIDTIHTIYSIHTFCDMSSISTLYVPPSGAGADVWGKHWAVEWGRQVS
jgi:hypothetical protein